MTDKENLKDTLAWMQRKLAAADKSLTTAAIAYFEYLMSEMDDHSDEYLAAKIALSALQDIPTSEPLTLEQLQEMEGKPVYVVDKMFPELSGWGIVRKDVCDGYQCVCFFENYGARWDSYVYPLANIY